jgi:proteasome lid subunit RPN8/RPN11
MSSEVEFGELREPTLPLRRRPDQNGQWEVVTCGTPDPQHLPIYVDLDTMLDVLQHAHSDTRVELGGVLLGQTGQDAEGKPFVMVTDSLRAEHYKATKGSFTFTHETWQAITRQRAERDPELQMVGWYHTHPGWGVFLSGMDLFICENFFAQPLDLALVVDPCQNDVGWFQWNDQRQTQRCASYYVFASRHRRQELIEFVEQQTSKTMARQNQSRAVGFGSQEKTTQVHVIEPSSSWHWFAWSALGMQLALIGWLIASQIIFYRTMVGPVEGNGQSNRAEVSAEQADRQRLAAEARAESFRELAQWLAQERGGEVQWVDSLAEAQMQRKQFESSNRSLSVRVDQLERELQQSLAKLDTLQNQPKVESRGGDTQTAGTSVPEASQGLIGGNAASTKASKPLEPTDASTAADWWNPTLLSGWLPTLMLVVGGLLTISGLVVWSIAFQNGWLAQSFGGKSPRDEDNADEVVDGIS